ncbi:MAG: glycosyltransferase family 2 protein, partial [Pseudomonadota bacterium]
LHSKFLNDLGARVDDALTRKQHYAAGREYRAYATLGTDGLMTPYSSRWTGWQQAEAEGLMARGSWA